MENQKRALTKEDAQMVAGGEAWGDTGEKCPNCGSRRTFFYDMPVDGTVDVWKSYWWCNSCNSMWDYKEYE